MKSATLTRLAGSKRTHEASEGNARPVSIPPAANNAGAPPTKAPGNDAAIRAFVDAVVSDWRGASKLLKEDFIISVIHRSREVIMAEPMLVKVDAPTNICGDLHGQIHDLSTILNTGGLPPKSRYLFLGDYVDRGKFGIECIITLLGLKILYPGNMFVLRGNHETDSICRVYGFYDECKRRFNFKLYKQFTDLFNVLPIAANVEDRALCMHGGLSPELHSLNQIAVLRRPMSIGDHGLACDILWSDPDASVTGWGYSERGVSCTFGADVVKRFCNKADIDLIVRAHQVMENGYEFFADRQLVTVFSASNYCGEFTNSGAMIVMDADLRCRFQVFRPEYDRK